MKKLFASMFSKACAMAAQPDPMRAWTKCNSCGHQDVKKQPCSVGGPCPKCGGSQRATLGTRVPDWFKKKT